MRTFNVVVLGAGGVGKSTLTVRYVHGTFVDTYDPTIEEQYRKNVVVDGETSTLEVMDTAGSEQFYTLEEAYIKGGRGFILVFSLTQEATLKELDNIRSRIYRIKGGDTNVPVVVVGTKLDLANEREVQRSTIQNLATSWKLPFYETSAKKNWHVTEVFEDLVRQMRIRYPPVEERKKKKRGPCVIM